jgi:hypothetical protein
MPEIVVLGDHFGGGRHLGADVGDIALEPDQGLCPGQAGFARLRSLPRVLTNRADLTFLSPSTIALARASCALSVFWSRRARLAEYAQIAATPRYGFGGSRPVQHAARGR